MAGRAARTAARAGRLVLVAAALAALPSGTVAAQSGGAAGDAAGDAVPTASAVMIDTEGTRIGRAELTETPGYGVLIRLEVEGLEPGVHGFHIHATGQCSLPDFGTAGGHFAPRGRSHGVLHPHGRHAGDLMNLHVPESGRLVTERLAEHVSLVPGTTASLLDEDGSALVIHANPDDYRSQPSGNGGPKVACGVIR